MNIIDFLGINVIMIGGVVLIVFIYLVLLINKRRKEKFLHKVEEKKT
jgi:septation ring formation regulator EzrA